jgi:pimeloyl-ACP methyl ester carboxylesterase/CRP-like cAMP-binding protein
MSTYNVRGQKLHVVEKGKSGRQLALLIHGWSSSWYAMSPLMEWLSPRFHCLSVDLPGYGQSPRPPERITIPAYADLLAELIAGLDQGPAVVIGHSMGGMTAVTMALRHPVLVERLVLLGPTITGRLSTYINVVVSPITILERFGLGSLIVSTVERLFVGLSDRIMRPASFAERTGISESAYERIRADARRPGQGRVRAECFFAMRNNDLTQQLHAVETPTLIIWGAEDNTVPLRDSGVVADEWPTADLRILPKAGHWPQFEAPDATRRLIAAYLGLPRFQDQVQVLDDDARLPNREIAQFLAHSDIGNTLNEAQRMRLAAQCVPRTYEKGDVIVRVGETGNEFYIIHDGTIEVWSDPEHPGEDTPNKRHVADLHPGQVVGELALFDKQKRSADLVAGTDGVTLLAVDRARLLGLCEDDAVLGTRLLWNIAAALSQRVRFVLWQMQRLTQQQDEAPIEKKKQELFMIESQQEQRTS